jgi:hypothetical protein
MNSRCPPLRLLAGSLVAGMLMLGVARLIDVDHFSGTLTTAAPDMIAVSVADETVMFSVSGITMVSLNGKPAAMGDLRAGDSVNVAAQSPGEDGMRLAMRVDAVRNDLYGL